MSDILKNACEACIADRGKEDDALVQRLYDYVHTHFEEEGKPWNYTLLDTIVDTWEKQEIEFRNLDGVYFRIERDGKWQNVCFSDLTKEEMEYQIGDRSVEWLKNLCIILGKTIRRIGDCFDISSSEDEE